MSIVCDVQELVVNEEVARMEKMNNTKYSVIIPVYNVGEYIKPCLQSILCQSVSHYEVIIVDDGSTEDSGAICDRYAACDPRIKVYHRENRGVSAARNFGVSKAQGDYILFLDADDYYTDCLMFEKIDQKLKTSDMVLFGVVGSLNGELISEPLPYASIGTLKNVYESGKAFLEDALTKNPGYMWWPWRYAFKRSVWQENRITFPEGIAFCEDAATVYKAILFMKKVSVIQEPFYAYRQQREGAATEAVTYSKNRNQLEIAVQGINYIRTLHDISEKLRELLCNNLAMRYYAALICSTQYSKEECKKCWRELQRHRDIAQYTATRKQKVAYQLIKYLGVPMTGRIMGIRRHLKYGK